jgi:WD40 repeat protein
MSSLNGPSFDQSLSCAPRLFSLQRAGDRAPAREFASSDSVGLLVRTVPADKESRTQHWVPQGFDDHRKVSVVAMHPIHPVMAIAEERLAPRFSLFSWPDRKLMQRVDNVGRLQIVDMCWNRHGTHFAVLTGAPLYNITVFTCDAMGRISTVPLVSQRDVANDHQYSSISFNPRNPLELCTSGGGHIAFWRVQDKADPVHMSCTQGRVSQSSASFTCHGYLANGLVAGGSVSGNVYLFDPVTGLEQRSTDVSSSPCVDLFVSKHCVVVATANGSLTMLTQSGTTVIRTIECPAISDVISAIFTGHDTFVLATRDGQINACVIPGFTSSNPVSADELQLLAPKFVCVDESFGHAAVAASISATTVVGIDRNGVMRVRDIQANQISVRQHVGDSPVSIVPLTGSEILVGYGTGTIRFVDVPSGRVTHQLRVAGPRESIRLFAPLTPAGFAAGDVVLAVTEREIIFVLTSSKVAAAKTVLPEGSEAVFDIAFVPDNASQFVVSTRNAALSLLQTPPGLAPPLPDEVQLPEHGFADVEINRWRTELPFERIAILSFHDGVSFNMFGASLDRETKFCTVDLTLSAQRKDKDSKALKMPVTFADHAKRCTFMTVVDRSLLVTAGADGKIVVRNVAALAAQSPNLKGRRDDPSFVVCRHDSASGGIVSAALSTRLLVTCGGDGSVSVWNASHLTAATPSPRPAPWVERSSNPLTVTAAPESTRVEDERLFFLEQRKHNLEAADRDANAAARKEVRGRVETLRARLHEVREDNAVAADDERVTNRDFLVERDQSHFDTGVTASIDAMRDDVKWKDLHADFVTHTLKSECWDQMATKLTPMYGLAKADLCVFSCHRRVVPASKHALLRKLKFLRRVEETDRRHRRVSELEDVVALKPDAEQDDDRTPPILHLPRIDLEVKMPPAESEAGEPVEPYLYQPMLAFTRHRAITQIVLLEAKTDNAMTDFNLKFTELQSQKKSEIEKMKERNLRCGNVQKELEDGSPLFAAAMRKDEYPNHLLEVRDEEVSADKSFDPEEQRRRSAEEAERERWRRQHGNDDSSERALKLWMDGRLEKEIKTLRVDVPLPDFADESNPKFVKPDERTDDQARLLKDYEKRLKARTEEVALQRRQLQSELAGLQKENADAAKKFDMSLEGLLLARLATMQQCTRIDLYRVKLAQSVALHRDRAVILRKLELDRASLADQVVKALFTLQRFQDDKKKVQDKHKLLVDDEKPASVEKKLRSLDALQGHEEAADRLVKIFANAKKKANAAGGRGARKGDKEGKNKAKADRNALAAQAEAKIASNPDPYAFIDAELEAKTKAQQEEFAAASIFLTRVEKPEGMSDDVWLPFHGFLNDRVEAECEIKKLYADLQEKLAEEAQLEALYSDLHAKATDRTDRLHQIRVESREETYDTDDLRMYRQGQVEVPQQPIATDYTDAVLIHSSDILELNKAIRQKGNDKVAFMEQMLKRRRELLQVEWEVEKYQYQCQTLELECRHLHTLRVTKQMQEFIHGGGEGYNERERAKLHTKIDHVRATMSTKIEEKKQNMAKVKRATREREMENQLLLEQVTEAETIVDSRRGVRDLQSSELEKERHNRLMRDMRVTRKLEDVAKAQQEEMNALRKEIDRLRERTFPSFAVVSKRVIGNPDEA